MSQFFFYQLQGAEENWKECLAEHRDDLIATKKPRYTTVLAVSAVTDKNSKPEELAALKYYGDAYFDWDAESIEIALGKFHEFLVKLEEIEVDLSMLRLFATGGRGFHCEIPIQILVAKPVKSGYLNLPGIYKELAFSLYTDTMDLRVYSGRKGRMWRTPNVERENGRFKIPLTVDQAKNMSVNDYEVLCSSPRPAPKITPPVLNQSLAVMFAKAQQKVDAAAKKRKDSTKDLALLAKFKGGFPPTLLKIMQAEIVPPNSGFHQIAMQIAITANALGKKEDETLTLCDPLLINHQSDGRRYNTPSKRRTELVRLLRYTQDNVCYGFSKGALKVLVPDGVPAPDLDGMTEEAGTLIAGSEDEDNEDRGGVFITKMGVFKRAEFGVQLLIDVSFADVQLLIDATTGTQLGFEAEVLVKGRSHGRHGITSSVFLSKSHFQRFAARHMGAAINATDAHIATVMTILRDTAYMNGNKIYIIGREGLEVIDRPDTKGEVQDILWVTPKEVVSESPVKYRFQGLHQKTGFYKSDLMDAPALEDTPEMREVINALLEMNTPFVVGMALGWAVSCNHKQIYQRAYSQFPLCQIYGPSGSGKTTTLESVMAFSYYKSVPLTQQADGATRFGLEGAMVGSASIPCAIDEYKPREMRAQRHNQLKTFFRGVYNSSTFSKGGSGQEVDASWADLRTFSYSAPVVFVGEALESETAIVDRSVVIPMSKDGIEGRRQHGRTVRAGRRLLASLGKQLARATFALKLEEFRESFERNRLAAEQLAVRRDSDRPIFNLAVVMTGLDFLREVLHATFGETFDAQLEVLRNSIRDTTQHVVMSVMPESSKVLNMLQHISNTEDPASEFGLAFGVDYVCNDDYLDLLLRNCYVKYVGWAKRKGQTALYDTEDAFAAGLRSHRAITDRSGVNSPLKQTGMEKIYRFDQAMLREEGVEPFKNKRR